MGILTLVGRVILLTLLHSLFYQRTMHAEAHTSPTEDKMISHSITVESEEMTPEPQEITLGTRRMNQVTPPKTMTLSMIFLLRKIGMRRKRLRAVSRSTEAGTAA